MCLLLLSAFWQFWWNWLYYWPCHLRLSPCDFLVSWNDGSTLLWQSSQFLGNAKSLISDYWVKKGFPVLTLKSRCWKALKASRIAEGKANKCPRTIVRSPIGRQKPQKTNSEGLVAASGPLENLLICNAVARICLASAHTDVCWPTASKLRPGKSLSSFKNNERPLQLPLTYLCRGKLNCKQHQRLSSSESA